MKHFQVGHHDEVCNKIAINLMFMIFWVGFLFLIPQNLNHFIKFKFVFYMKVTNIGPKHSYNLYLEIHPPNTTMTSLNQVINVEAWTFILGNK